MIEENLVSSYVDHPDPLKRERCFVGDLCSIKITLKDSYCNDLDQELGIIKWDWFAIQIMGPFDNPDFESKYRYEQNMTQYFDDHPEWYFINYSIEKVGLHKIYLRFRRPGAEVMYPRLENYPLEIRTYSDKPSETKS
jgi:hypothetical protein